MRLIDATRIEQFILNNCSDNEEINTIYGELINAPTIDIITCGECKYWHEGEWYNTCDKHIGHGFEDDYFCKYGERREDERGYSEIRR